MACCGDSNITEQEDENYITFDQSPKPRSFTDKVPLIIMVIFFGVLFILLGVAMVNGDIDQLINGFDECGNICGRNNTQPEKSFYPCFGKDMTDKKYLLTTYKYTANVNYTEKTCVHDCNAEGGYVLFLNRCFLKSTNSSSAGGNFLENFSEDLQRSWGYIVLMSLLALVFSIIMMFLLRYATAFVVWFILIAICAVLVVVSVFLWREFMKAEESSRVAMAILAGMFTGLASLVIILILVFIKRIKLIIQLFKEAVKAVSDMPLLLLQPVWTFISLIIIFVCGSYFSMWILSYTELTDKKNHPDVYNSHFEDDGMPYIALTYELTTTACVILLVNWFGIMWMIQFVLGCQHLIVGGSVASWYFTRDKNNLNSPIKTSTSNLLTYHLGTIAFGSLIITILECIKQLVRYIRLCMHSRKNLIMTLLLYILGSCIEWLEQILKFFSRNAYIMTALYGMPFCQGGRKAFKLLLDNIFSVIAINSIGDYVLLYIKMFIVLFTTLIGYEVLRGLELHMIWLQLIIILVIAGFISHCFISIIEMTIEAIFLCFCEDCNQNDGLSKPYYMSRNLIEFVENSSKVMKVPWEVEQLQSWENGPKRILQQPY